MTGNSNHVPPPQQKRRTGLRGHIAGIVALIGLSAAAGSYFWLSRQGPQLEAGYGVPHGIVLVGAGVFLAALVAEIRAMSFSDLLEALGELFLGTLAALGAILSGVWSAIRGLFGWD